MVKKNTNWIILAIMLITVGLSKLLQPTIHLADELPPFALNSVVPSEFKDWKIGAKISSQIVNPQQTQILNQIYTQLLTRNYVNKDGYRIMLSIAYGKDQSDELQLHKPEVCYPAQGFQVIEKSSYQLNLVNKKINATHVYAKLESRNEPITYWTILGSTIVSSGIDKKIAQIQYAVNDRIPDGMLVRVSSIDADVEMAYKYQENFLKDLVASIDETYRGRFIGSKK